MEREPIILDVYGLPTPQGSKKLIHGRIIEASSAKLQKWRKEVQSVAMTHLHETGWTPFTGPVELRVTFFLPRPPSVKRTGKNAREYPIVPPDLDKLVRGVGDALTYGEVWGDDSQVVSMVCHKRYADEREPGAEIEIHSVTI